MSRTATAILTALLAIGPITVMRAQEPTRQPAARPPAYPRGDAMAWHLPTSDQAYATIDSAPLMRDVEAQTAISRRYRDRGHQFWGRITGTEADAENAQWLMQRFREIGLSDVHEQSFDLLPQWMPRSWSVTASSGGKTLELDTAQPTYLSVGTPPGGLDLEAVWVGLASDADLAMSPDVKGKAAFVYSIDTSSRHIGVQDNAIKRLADRGAAAIVVVQGIPGNLRTQFYPVNSPVPTFSMGQEDGFALRDLVGLSPSPTRVSIRLDVERVPNLTSRTVWGTLPGMTDETVVVIAHRDGWFEGANDNATGVATALGIAGFFAKMPKQQRKRTIVFLGTTGHHDNGAESGVWLGEHPEFFAKTAVMLNAEHTGAAESGHNSTRLSNGSAAATWFAGSDALSRLVIDAMDACGVVSYPQSSARPAGEIGRYFQLAPSMQIMTSGFVWHSDEESADTISPETLAAITRAYAKVIADSNALPLDTLRKGLTPVGR